ncbi:MAG: hypothetical protein JXB13_05190 [Phycisphaerae bacterium]|nr:hypothetical protein [Phycisphaerae bacterium]
MSMRRGSAIAAVLALANGGCSITGTWRVQSVDPPSTREEFPLHHVTFEDEGTYFDEPLPGEEGEPNVGQYSWNPAFYTLHLTPKGSTTQFYRGYIRMDRKLVVTRTGKGPKHRAILVRETAKVEPAP